MHLSQKFKILKVHNLFYQKFPFLLQFGLYFTIIVLKIAFFNIMIVKSTFFFIDFCFFNKIILDEEDYFKSNDSLTSCYLLCKKIIDYYAAKNI